MSSTIIPKSEPSGPEKVSSLPAGFTENVSKIFRSAAPGDWQHIPVEPYKKNSDSYKGITRRELIGKRGESTAFHMRYFEIEKGGYSTLEKHHHEHAVMVVRGHGQVRIGCQMTDLGPGDVVYVSPDDPHQFLNLDHQDPFGFLCIVNAERDRPQMVDGNGFCEICE